MSKAETANLAQAIAGGITEQFGFDGTILTILTREGWLFVAAAMVDEPRAKFMSAIAAATATMIEKHEQGHPMATAPHLISRAACIHCKSDVAATTDVEAIRHHSTTCPASPVARELAAAKVRIAQLEAELADAQCDRAEVAPVWEPAPRAE